MGINSAFPQASKGYATAIPHPFSYHSHGGGADTSGSVIKRLMLRLFRSFTPFQDTKNQQPTAGAQTNAYLGRYVGAVPFIGNNAIACGAAPNPFQPGMLYMPSESFPVTGLGGLVNGEMLAQDLIDPSNSDIPGV